MTQLGAVFGCLLLSGIKGLGAAIWRLFHKPWILYPSVGVAAFFLLLVIWSVVDRTAEPHGDLCRLLLAWCAVDRTAEPHADLFRISVLSFLLACLNWLFRSDVEDSPDPFLLSIALFAVVAQTALLGQLIDSMLTFSFAASTVLVWIILFAQIKVFRNQRYITVAYLTDVFRDIARQDHDGEAELWANVALDHIGNDFYPEVFMQLGGMVPSRKRRRGFFLDKVLPADKFDKGKLRQLLEDKRGKAEEPESLLLEDADMLIVPRNRRTKAWRAYAILAILAWAVHLSYVVSVAYPMP